MAGSSSTMAIRRFMRYRLQRGAAGLKHAAHVSHTHRGGRPATFRHNSCVPRHFGAPMSWGPAGENPAMYTSDRRPVMIMTLPSSSRYRRVGFGGAVADWLGLIVLLALCFICRPREPR